MLLLGTLHIKEQEGKGHYNKFHNDILSRKDFPHETFTVRSPVCWHPLTAEHSSVLWTETQLDNVRISAENCANFFNFVHCQAMLHAHSHFFLVIKEKKIHLKSYSESWVTNARGFISWTKNHLTIYTRQS